MISKLLRLNGGLINTQKRKIISQLFTAPILNERTRKVATDTQIYNRINSEINDLSLKDCSQIVNELSHFTFSPDTTSKEFKLLI